MKKNQLFIICPFSCLETYLQENYGKEIFFLTYSGAVLLYEQYEYICEIKNFIYRENIGTIYIVNDTSCKFINGIINKNKICGFPAEKVLEELFIENYFTDFKDQSNFHQQYKLAELNIRNQLQMLINSTILGSCISESNIEVKGLITSKEKNLCHVLHLDHSSVREF